MHLKLNLELAFVVASRVVFFVVKVVWKKFSTGVAKMNSRTPDTSSAPVPTKVCFNSLMTGFTYTYFTTKFSFSAWYMLNSRIFVNSYDFGNISLYLSFFMCLSMVLKSMKKNIIPFIFTYFHYAI